MVNILVLILKEDIESYADNPGRFAFSRIYEIMCPNSVIKYRSTGYIEDLEKVMDEYNIKNLSDIIGRTK